MRPFSSCSRRVRLAWVAAMFAGGFGAAPAAAAEFRVVASIKPVHSLVSAVMAGAGEPHLLMRGRASPHSFALRPSDASALADAHVVFLIGEAMETSLADRLDPLAGDARIVMLADAGGLVHRSLREGGAFADHADDHARSGEEHGHEEHGDEEHGDEEHGAEDGHDEHAHDHGAFDPHVWLDPVNGAAMARAIADALAETDPANAATYRANARALLAELDTVTGQIEAELASSRGQPFVVFHDAYRHFEDRFGLQAVGSIVVSPERAPGAKRLRELRARVRDSGAACVFDEPQFDRRIVNVVVEGGEVRTGTLDPLGASIEDGPELYFLLLRRMAAAFRACLDPAT